MLFVYNILVFLCFPITYSLGASVISEDYPQDSRYWFKYHEEARSWHEARKTCDLEGGRLLSPLDEDSTTMIEMFANSSTMSCDSVSQVYVGVHATISAGVWHSVEGTPLLKIKDYVDIQNLIESQNQCAIFQSGSLKAVNCTKQYPYICYKPNSDVTYCETSDKNYVFNEKTGSCYKYHGAATSWLDAYETCYTERAHLVVINSQTEAIAVLDIAKRNKISNYFSIGIIDWENDGKWYTIHGKRLQNSDYPKWRPSEPSGALFCGFMNVPEGHLTNRGCATSNVTFICEKEV